MLDRMGEPQRRSDPGRATRAVLLGHNTHLVPGAGQFVRDAQADDACTHDDDSAHPLSVPALAADRSV